MQRSDALVWYTAAAVTSSVSGLRTRVNGNGIQIIGTVWQHATWLVTLAIALSVVATSALALMMLDVPAARALPDATL